MNGIGNALLLGSLLISLPSQATGWNESELYRIQQQKEAQAASFFTPDKKQQHLQAFIDAQQYKTSIQQLQQKTMTTMTSKATNQQPPIGVMVFASLGMPKTSLSQLLTQASQFNIPVVTRGLWQNDFKATATKIQSLILPKEGEPILGGVEINPTWFKQFDIQRVPAFVAIKNGACLDEPPCSPKDYDIVYGNVSLFDALATLVREGQHTDIARKYLQ